MRKNYYPNAAQMIQESFGSFQIDQTVFHDTDYGKIRLVVDGVDTKRPYVAFSSTPSEKNTFTDAREEEVFDTIHQAFAYLGIQ